MVWPSATVFSLVPPATFGNVYVRWDRNTAEKGWPDLEDVNGLFGGYTGVLRSAS
jgi:hypothetical protein